MDTTSIAVINGQTLQVSNDEQQLVPIKPICQALGVNYTTQVDKLQDHPIFNKATVPLRGIVAADGKSREMLCLPMEYIFGWIFSINPNNVSEEARPVLMKYQDECNHALYEYFTKGMKKERELLEAENKYLKDLDEARKLLAEHKDGVASAKKQIADIERNLTAIRDERHNAQPRLFD